MTPEMLRMQAQVCFGLAKATHSMASVREKLLEEGIGSKKDLAEYKAHAKEFTQFGDIFTKFAHHAEAEAKRIQEAHEQYEQHRTERQTDGHEHVFRSLPGGVECLICGLPEAAGIGKGDER